MAVAAILDLFRWTMGPPTKPHSWCVHPVKISSWSVSSFQVKRIWILFVVQAWKSYSVFTAPKFSFGGFTIKFRDTPFRPPKGTSLRGTTSFEPSLVQIWRTVRPVLGKENKKRKKNSGKLSLAIRPDHSRRRMEVKGCVPGGLQCIVLYFKFC